jgi:hypothetical protein
MLNTKSAWTAYIELHGLIARRLSQLTTQTLHDRSSISCNMREPRAAAAGQKTLLSEDE